MLRDTSERSYHQQSEELVHNTSDSSFIKVALLKQKQKILDEQQGGVDSTQQGDSSDDTSIYSWDRKLSILKQKQRDREDMNEQRKQQQKQQRVATASSSVDKISLNAPQLTTNTIINNNSEQQIDILTEGQHYLSISMLVYMYSHLRETCRMGHTRINFEDIDVNSFQSLYGRKRFSDSTSSNDESGGKDGRIRYLDKTKSSGSIIRVVIDELGGLGSSNGGGGDKRDYDLIGVNASREYEQR